jgi:anion-transporting  ArsA/GET3 family ATPase
MQEWTLLGKAWWHTTETRADGGFLYDVVILDAPATGHGLDMLRVPKVILDVVPPGLLRRDAERAWELFQDPANCAVVLVTLPEEMPTSETIELAQALRDELKLPIGKVVVNCVLPPLFSKEERSALESAPASDAQSPADAAFMAGRRRALREDVQAAALARLSRELPVPPSFLPQLFEDAAQPSAIRELAKRVG